MWEINRKPVAVVTGASRGIGAAVAQRLAADGFEVVRMSRSLETGGRSTGYYSVDVRDASAVDDVADAVVEAYGSVDLLINNAGVPARATTVADSDAEDWRDNMETNVLGAANVTRAFLPALRASRGSVIFIGSTVGRVPYENGAAYAASKHAVRALAETLRLEEVDNAVRVTEIAPGMMKGDDDGGAFMRRRFSGDQAQVDAVYRGVTPLTPVDIAECVAWVASLPEHVNIDSIVVKPVAQAAHHKVIRR